MRNYYYKDTLKHMVKALRAALSNEHRTRPGSERITIWLRDGFLSSQEGQDKLDVFLCATLNTHIQTLVHPTLKFH